jgi:hypothetical protein
VGRPPCTWRCPVSQGGSQGTPHAPCEIVLEARLAASLSGALPPPLAILETLELSFLTPAREHDPPLGLDHLTERIGL